MDAPELNRAGLRDRDLLLTAGLLLLTAAGLGLRLWFASHRDLWYDELVLWQISQGTLPEIIAKNRSLNLAPPLYPLLVHVVSLLFGSSEIALRSISLAAGLLSIPAGYMAGKAQFNRAAGWVTAALAAVTTNLVQYSGELREYSLVVLLIFILVWLLAGAERGLRRWIWWAGMLLTLAALVWVQYGAAIVAVSGALVLTALAAARRTHIPRMGWALAALASVLGLSLLAVVELGLKDQAASGQPFYLPDAYLDRSTGTLIGLLRLASNTLGIFAFALGASEPFYYLLLALAVGGGAALFLTHSPKHLAFLALVALSWLATFTLAVLGKYPYTGRRHDMMLVPFAFLLAAYALSLLLNRRGVPAAAGTVLVLILLTGPLIYMGQGKSWLANQPFSQIAKRLAAVRTENQPILLTPFTPPAMAYYGRGFSGEIIELPAQSLISDLAEQCAAAHPAGCWVVYAHCLQCEAELPGLPAELQPRGLKVSDKTIVEGGFVGAVLLQREKP